ncbi:hypothetical protein CVO74_06695 [Xanthomonas prunicola]|uniref:Uncharacterized protein n=1 Tax=Xanthomonas prunicola TaxID=2053930 RepID=A0A2N3RHF0_9XANT|nr:hypothetical protein XpruCFBP8353_13735 [Xanthomonas prunicola]PKV16214.1 hypothetical protein XpruCFBP8354_13720 [Xanthomonas prunicola]PKV22879.1 hypothetical protein CVO74_06695 [Xanthomonas prunicola]
MPAVTRGMQRQEAERPLRRTPAARAQECANILLGACYGAQMLGDHEERLCAALQHLGQALRRFLVPGC